MTSYQLNQKAAEIINNNKTVIEQAMKTNFGITCNLTAKAYDRYIAVSDESDDVNAKMRGNKLLKAIFKTVTLDGTAWYDETENIVSIRFTVHYNHTHGGSNGYTFACADYNVNSNTVTFREIF